MTMSSQQLVSLSDRRERARLSRREFIQIAGAATSAFAIFGCSGSSFDPNSPRLPSLGGGPDSHDGRVVAAFVDTIVPSRYRDPEGKPGALDVGATAVFFDPELPALAFVPLLVPFLDGGANRLFNNDFDQITPSQRDAVVDDALAGFPPMEFAVQLAKLAFFSSQGGMASLGYPGANPGYINDPDFGFDMPLTTEITKDGNLD
jgi:hypothetical protein